LGVGLFLKAPGPPKRAPTTTKAKT